MRDLRKVAEEWVHDPKRPPALGNAGPFTDAVEAPLRREVAAALREMAEEWNGVDHAHLKVASVRSRLRARADEVERGGKS